MGRSAALALVLFACTKQKPAPVSEDIAHLEIVTGGARSDERLPAIVAIHGLGDRPDSFRGIFDRVPFRARVIIPQGIEAYGDGFRWFRARTGEGRVEELSVQLSSAADRVDHLLAEVTASHGPPVVTGFSQGGMLTFVLAVRHPEHVRAAIPIGGWLPAPLDPEKAGERPPSIRALHGTSDPIIPFELDQLGVDRLRALGFDATLAAFEGVPHTITPEMHETWSRLVDAALSTAHAPAPVGVHSDPVLAPR